MRTHIQRIFAVIALMAVGAMHVEEAAARPSMGRMGGGGGRPSMPHMSAPRPSPQRPNMNMSRPSMPNMSRPSGGRPSMPSRPATGNFHPSGSRPNFSGGANRPSLPGGGSGRPNAGLGEFKPVTRPSMPSFGGSGGGRPEFGRPGTGGIGSGGVGSGIGAGGIGSGSGRPGITERPSLGGGSGINRPGITERPSLGGLNRPTTLPADIGRPGVGGGRPGGIGDGRPGIGTGRPGVGDGGLGQGRPGTGRPIIGGGNGNRPIIGGGGNNINIGDNINIGGGNIGSGNIGNNRPGWGLGGGQGNWGDHWHNNYVNNHYHNWYNGCWHGHYGYGYYPYMWGAVGYGLGSWWSYPMWGYGASYYNPYYGGGGSGYDYSQPVVVNNYVTSNADSTGGAGGTGQGGTAQGGTAQGGTAQGGAAQAQQTSPEAQKSMQLFDQALADFKAQNYIQAATKLESALQLTPKDPVLHEVRALCMFAQGRYAEAAAGLNALLATAPGMDWTSMSNLYGDTDVYTQQLRKLESHIKANPTDSAAIFVLAYHYLVIGENDKAIDALKHVVKLQPKDATAQRMLSTLSPPTSSPDSLPTPPPPAGSEAPQTDLVGNWTAKAGDTTIQLSIDEQSQFTWNAAPAGKAAIELKGKMTASTDMLILESEKQGSMVGRVVSKGADRFVFSLQGAPPSDPGLDFQRVK